MNWDCDDSFTEFTSLFGAIISSYNEKSGM